MTKLIFACLNKLNNSLECDDTNCIFNSQGKNPRCEYFDNEDNCLGLYNIPEQKDTLFLKGDLS